MFDKIKENLKNVDWKSAGIGAVAVLATEAVVYSAIKGTKAIVKKVKSAYADGKAEIAESQKKKEEEK